MQLVVVIAVSAADSAAMTTRTITSHTFFFSFKKLREIGGNFSTCPIGRPSGFPLLPSGRTGGGRLSFRQFRRD